MTDFFTLRDCSEINIDNNSVERIEMFGDIVWEKIRATTTTLSIEPAIFDEATNTYSITKNNTLTLKASTIDSKNTILQNGTIIFSNGTQSYSREIIEGTASLSLTTSSVGDYTWTATFQKTKKYKQSKNTIKIKVKKDTPKITMINENPDINGVYQVYNGWIVGATLTTSNNIPLTGKEYRVFIRNNSWEHGVYYGDQNQSGTYGTTSRRCTSQNKGIMKLNINSLVEEEETGAAGMNDSKYQIRFCFDGDKDYEAVSLLKYIEVLSRTSQTLYPINWRYEQTLSNHQAWTAINNKSFQCSQIAPTGQGLNRPGPLIIAFPVPPSSYVLDATLLYRSMQKGCTENSMGGVFKDKPKISISYGDGVYNAIPESQVNAFPTGTYGNNIEASMGPIWQKVTWKYVPKQDISSTEQILIKIEYFNNTGREKGLLTIEDVALTVSYAKEEQKEKEKFIDIFDCPNE